MPGNPPSVPSSSGWTVVRFSDVETALTTRCGTAFPEIHPPERRITQVTDFARFAVRSAPIVAVARTRRFDTMLTGDSSSSFNADCQPDDDAKR